MRYFSLILICLLFTACSSDDDNASPLETDAEEALIDPGFFGLAIGNSWSYQVYRREALTDDPLVYNPIDISWTVSITDTIIISGEKYFERTYEAVNGTGISLDFFPLEGTSTDLVRDSLGFLIDRDGDILFSSINTSPVLLSAQPFGDVFIELLEDPSEVTVEAGDFNCRQNEIYAFLNPDGERAPGTSRYFFADGLGAVQWNIATVSVESPLFRVDLTAYASVTD
jgi:hypothetical protein